MLLLVHCVSGLRLTGFLSELNFLRRDALTAWCCGGIVLPLWGGVIIVARYRHYPDRSHWIVPGYGGASFPTWPRRYLPLVVSQGQGPFVAQRSGPCLLTMIGWYHANF